MRILHIVPFKQYSAKDAGYGNAASLMCRIFDRLVIDHKIESVDHLTMNETCASSVKYDLCFISCNPFTFINNNTVFNQILDLRGRAERILLSVVWETSPLPEEWTPVLNSGLFDGIVTPSFFVLNEISRITSKRVYYYPHHIDISQIPEPDMQTRLAEKSFNVLFVGQNTKRKGLEDAVIGFARALGEMDDTSLTIKCHSLSKYEHDVDISTINTTRLNCNNFKSRIYTIKDNISGDEVMSLYRNSSILLHPSRGEGFGLALAEAMASGIPSVYTSWSAMPEVCSLGYNYPVGCFIDEAHGMSRYGYSNGLKYAIPKIGDIMSSLTSAYQTWKNSREEYYSNAFRNRGIINMLFGAEHVCQCVEHIISNLASDAYSPCSEQTEKLIGRYIHEGSKDDTHASCSCSGAASGIVIPQAEPLGVCDCHNRKDGGHCGCKS